MIGLDLISKFKRGNIHVDSILFNEDVLGFPMPENINELQQDIQGRSKFYILQIMARHTHIITFVTLFYRI